jgi:uncharacterized protein (TIGR03067 family)
MTAWVLVLAGVTAGDGGMRAGAATAPLTGPMQLDLSRDWEGTVHYSRDDSVPVRLSGGQMTFFAATPYTLPCKLTLAHGGLAFGTCGDDRLHGIYKVDGDRLLICVTQVTEPRPAACSPDRGRLLTLKPAAGRP